MKFPVIIVIVTFLLNSAHAAEMEAGAEETSCQIALNPENPLAAQFLRAVNKEVPATKSRVTLKEARFSVAEFILNKGSLPDVLKIPSLLSRGNAFKKPFASLEEAQQEKIRFELVSTAIKKHKGARETIVEKLAKALIKQFSKDYTLPSFSKLAEVVDSTALELTEMLYAEKLRKEDHEVNAKNGYKELIAEIQNLYSMEFENIRKNFRMVYAKKAREFGRTLDSHQFFSALLVKKSELAGHFTKNHLAYLVGEELPDKETKIQKPYIRLFDSLEDLYMQALKSHAADFDKVVDRYKVNAESQKEIANLLVKHDRIFLMAAAPSVYVAEEAFAVLLKMAEEKDIPIIIYPEAGEPMLLDPLLVNHPRVYILHDTIEASPWLELDALALPFKRQDPNSPDRQPGRGGRRGKIKIAGHPQMRDETVPTVDNHLFSHRLVKTGAITKDWYASKKLIGKVTDEQARDVHVVGVTMIEKDRDDSGLDGLGTPNTWHYRQIEWSFHSRSFIDDGIRYSLRENTKVRDWRSPPVEEVLRQQEELGIDLQQEDVVKHEQMLNRYMGMKLFKESVRPEILIPGDKHIGGDDQWGFTQVEMEAIKTYRPRRIALHDLFDGKSINHWESQNILLMAKKAAAGELNLQKELDKVVAYVNSLLMLDPEMQIIIVESNHNNWLTRLLREVKNLSQPINDPLVHELIHAAMNMDIDPLQYYLTKRADKIAADPDRKYREKYVSRVIDDTRIQFLPKGASLKFGPMEVKIEVGEHFHNGGGLRGTGITIRTTAGRSYTAIVGGHTHQPGRFNKSGNSGASIGLRQDYAIAGPSAVGMAFTNVYDDSTFQVHHYNPHSQTYKLGEGTSLPAEEFFYITEEESWPRVMEHEEREKNIDTLDQWRGVRSEGR